MNKKGKKYGLIAVVVLAVLIVLIGVVAIIGYSYAEKKYEGQRQWVYLPANADNDAICDSLVSALGEDFGMRVYRLWSMMDGKVALAHGAYAVDSGMTAISLSRTLLRGIQSPVPVVFNNLRTMEQLAQRIASSMEFDADAFLVACDSILPPAGFNKSEYPAAFIPDTYEFYWTISPSAVVTRLLDYRNQFWDDSRREKAKQIGLSPVGVATIASIVEEETAKRDERPKVARLYLNRLAKNMKLQADPTVKFAVGDFSLRRITGEHLKVQSPYNTYLNAGLPPGPIRIVDKSTIDNVLDAPIHQYLYMCAKEDFSGYHNFAVDYATHRRNAVRYQAELNRRNIK